jgi:hypothetical protein
MVRPDGYVAWAGPAAQVAEAAQTLVGRVPVTA